MNKHLSSNSSTEISLTTSFIDRWKTKLNNVTSPLLEENWKQNFEAFNKVINNNKNNLKAVKIISPSATGTGKSQNIIHKCIHLVGTSTKSLVVVMRTLDADGIAQQIKNETNHNYVASFHSKELAEEFNIKKHSGLAEAIETQCLVITHAMFKIALSGTRDRDKLLEDRDLIIIDEEISAITTDRFEIRDLEEIIELVGSINNEDLQSEMTGVRAIVSMMKKEFHKDLEPELDTKSPFVSILGVEKKRKRKPMSYNSNADFNLDNEATDSFVPISMNGIINAHGDRTVDKSKINLEHTINFLANTKKSPSDIFRGIHSEEMNEKLFKQYISACKRYRYIFTQFTYFYNSGGLTGKNISINTASEILPDRTVMIMDATASVNSTYKLYSDYQSNLKVLKRIECRDYKNVTVNVAKMTTGKDTIMENSDKYSQLLVNEIHHKTTVDDNVLVIVHKALEPNIIKLLSDEERKTISVDHWGNITGTNDYRKCNKIFVLGLNHKPKLMMRNLHILAKGAELAFDNTETNKEELHELETTNLAAEIVQAINRGACRSVADADGNCPVTDIYLTLPVDSKNSLAIRRGIESEMTNINMQDWKMLNTQDRKVIKNHSASEAIILEITNQLCKASSINSDTIRSNLDLEKKPYSRVLRSSRFKELLKEAQIEIEMRTAEPDRWGRIGTKKVKYFVKG